MSNSSNIVFIIGAARSGTTLLGEQILSNHPDIHFLLEPDYIWKPAIGYSSHDILSKEDAKGWRGDLVYKRLMKQYKKIDQSVLLEKTPSNCLRVPFINSLFPNAKFIHIIRDGRDVAISSSKEWSAKKSNALDNKNLREASFFERITKTIAGQAQFTQRFNSIYDIYLIPKYMIQLSKYLRRQFFKNDKIPWGPKIFGIKEVRKKYSLIESCAIQWERSVVAAESALSEIEPERVLRLHYEDFIEKPNDYLGDICHFMDISTEDNLIEKLSSSVVSGNISKWKQALSNEELDSVHNQISFTLKNLGYEI